MCAPFMSNCGSTCSLSANTLLLLNARSPSRTLEDVPAEILPDKTHLIINKLNKVGFI